ncbi:MAG TPA: HEPN domain-containing protein [Woeseiaceae bacterium]|nr:HEPN domain-containing protein [Woeseiaceae bacterium]
MSDASVVFEQSIQDAENLLRHFNSLNTKPPPPEIEVLKRAGLIMAMTAWETYVEDLLQEASSARLCQLANQDVAEFVSKKLSEEIKRLHNPDYNKTIELFRDYAGIDLTQYWSWNHYDLKTVRQRLGQYMKLRGDIVHRSRVVEPGAPSAHPVKKVDLEKAISFLKNLVEATEKAFTALG